MELVLAYKITTSIYRDRDNHCDSIDMKDIKKELNLSADEYQV